MAKMAAVLVEVELQSGAIGWGESIARLAPGAAAAVVDELLAGVVIGGDAWEVEALWDQMFATMRARGHSRGIFVEGMAGVDIALWDALGRELGLLIAKLLHGPRRAAVDCYASSILLTDADTAAREAAQLVSTGHRAVKMKIGRDPVTNAAAA
jgi:L-alanine-DL-glutamate epimerase-like enolase superfamily enzyme